MEPEVSVNDDWAEAHNEPEVRTDTFRNFEEECDTDSDDEQDMEFHDMQLFLTAIGEPQLVERFVNNRVTLGQLLEFNEDDLIRCGIELVGDRKKILANIGQMHCEKWQPSSLQELTSKSLLSSPGIYIALNDINKHLEYIGVTFKYLKRRLEEKPEIMELGKDYVGVTKIYSEIEDLLKTSKTSYAQLKSLEKEVTRHLDDPVKRPANHIDAQYLAKAKMRRRIVPTLVVTLAVCATIRLTCLFMMRQ